MSTGLDRRRERLGGSAQAAVASLAAIIMAMAAGYTDAFAYVRYGVFAANMTGNIVLLAIATVSRNLPEVVRHVAPIAAFMVGVVASRLLRQADNSSAASLLLAALIVAVVAAIDPTHGLLAACALSAAMGAQNTAITRFNGVSLNTAFLTGDLQRLGRTLVDPAPQHDRWAALATTAATIVAYVIGAGAGALSVPYRSPALLISAALLVVVACIAHSCRTVAAST